MNILKNKTAVITGAGSGMGKAMSILFAEEGANVVACDINSANLESTVSEIKAAGNIVTGITGNISDENDVKKIINNTIALYGGVDILVNNAGILDDFMTVNEMKDEMWNKILSVNLTGPMFACREALHQMLKQGNGVIVNIASVGGLFGARGGAAYTVSKHGLIGLTKNIGFTYAKKGIRCNAIAPGAVNTNIGANMHPDMVGFEALNAGMVINPRTADPSEIATVALFLASDKSSFINGTVVTADGGWTSY